LAHRTIEYGQRGWIEDHRRAEQHRTRYSDDPASGPFLTRLAAEEQRVKSLLDISDEEVSKLKRWPRLVDMISRTRPNHPDRIKAADRRSFLEYLDHWFYAEFSRDAHLSGPGLYRRGELLLTERRLWTEQQWHRVQVIRSDYLIAGTALMLALAAELACELNFHDVAVRIAGVWERLSFHSPMTWELYRIRHRARIATMVSE
jgi:hypothetical protein